MRIREKLSILFIVTLIIIATILSVIIWNKLTKETSLTTEEIYNDIETMYGGEIISFLTINDQYRVQLQRNNKLYQLNVDAESGKILQMTQDKSDVKEDINYLPETKIRKIIKEQYDGKIKKISLNTNKEEPVYQIEIANGKEHVNLLIDAINGEVLSEIQADAEQDSSLLSKEQAITIAKKKLNGAVDEISFYDTSDGGYYLVEIEGKDKDAVFQIHAISGKVISTTWD
ncbi:PepSY domain-containing protein [Viridibacillus arvi]|uniref:PepSY domain-containing protein n=1 Tax=Viridibacillus arvi TaxID=263475 RepID=UPI00187B2972|nr:PepSY domain-containing protein [Viridibacillus sp. JNUCC-6]QOV10239.1 PepSY domain-containing protein [Viridibacillus sp. JNUCC-6]